MGGAAREDTASTETAGGIHTAVRLGDLVVALQVIGNTGDGSASRNRPGAIQRTGIGARHIRLDASKEFGFLARAHVGNVARVGVVLEGARVGALQSSAADAARSILWSGGRTAHGSGVARDIRDGAAVGRTITGAHFGGEAKVGLVGGWDAVAALQSIHGTGSRWRRRDRALGSRSARGDNGFGTGEHIVGTRANVFNLASIGNIVEDAGVGAAHVSAASVISGRLYLRTYGSFQVFAGDSRSGAVKLKVRATRTSVGGVATLGRIGSLSHVGAQQTGEVAGIIHRRECFWACGGYGWHAGLDGSGTFEVFTAASARLHDVAREGIVTVGNGVVTFGAWAVARGTIRRCGRALKVRGIDAVDHWGSASKHEFIVTGTDIRGVADGSIVSGSGSVRARKAGLGTGFRAGWDGSRTFTWWTWDASGDRSSAGESRAIARTGIDCFTYIRVVGRGSGVGTCDISTFARVRRGGNRGRAFSRWEFLAFRHRRFARPRRLTACADIGGSAQGSSVS